MKTIQVSTIDEIAASLASIIGAKLNKNEKVLWLISGGSSIPIAVKTAHLLRSVIQSNLYVTLVDDIYNSDSSNQTNWNKLHSQGFVLENGTEQTIILENTSLDAAGNMFSKLLDNRLEWADFTVGQFGLGAGYHTGGIQPHSLAAKEINKLAIGYIDGDIMRVTVTPALVARLDLVIVNSLGEEKRPLIEHFLESSADILEEPTQALKTAKNVVLYSDFWNT